ncbi:MAG: hypothetical protein G01um101477_397 [Candidatus Doudnabacteria bacterium Gr01-1014_77]|uniref:Uncharacterized protein n=1 Tax=Candidatus Doudnabacteria bacterium Gr01-1014_77 TaxID=2017133 RepID=A0A554JB88_9BACT|nr:MAG: hypothetical protein G01um101477_397 [Candidatus Doudnabacteria bacterium Gr01-1014_77]
MQRILLQFVSIALFALTLQGQGSRKADCLTCKTEVVGFDTASARVELEWLVFSVLQLRPVLAENPCDSAAGAKLAWFFAGTVLDSVKADLSRACRNKSQPRFTRSKSQLRQIKVVTVDSAVIQSHENFGWFFWWNGTWHWTARRSQDNQWRLYTVGRRKPQEE